ncbi:Xenotropic and polytropic retrovirus receptor 1 [Gigaspora margarita]|uniref:Xenotropic and polytropic retrovirus receptor 1 n=1 Tax=Gigaspora margarita TaxID=4874 RepID=A0A8H4B1R4_GIGMA|nr:Xenotropic and polytropic retrovirus receptor 1 [Gigaspora margarita]
MKFDKLLQTESVPEWKKKYIDYKSLKVKLEKIQQAQYVESHSSTTYFSNVCESPISEHDSYRHFPFFDENQSKLQNEQSEPIQPTNSEPVKPPSIPLKIKINSIRRTNSTLTKVPSRSRSKSSLRVPIISIDTIKNQLHPDEVEFFEALDIELKKINEFYEEKELDAKERFTKINQAYEELKTLKRVKQSNPSRNDWTSKLIKERDNNGSNSPINESSLVAINYKNARKKMKKAICEFYRGTEMLKNYRNLNYAGFKKILEKFDMVTRLNGSEIYMQNINESNFVKSKKLDTLMRDTEYIYSELFGGNSRSHAMKKLKTPNRRHKVYYLPTIRSGIYIGLAALSLYHALKIANGVQIQLYAGFILPEILLLLIGILMYIWTKRHINYKFIFEFNPRDNLDFRQYIEIPSFMLMTVCFMMYADAFNLFKIPHPYYPLILVLVMLAILFCPLRIFYYSARRWFVYSLGRISPFIAQSICNLSTSITPLAPILGSFGPIMRFAQCIRRYYDTNTELHLRNAGKRWQWDIFRIENEHLTNCESGHAIKDIHLPIIFDPSKTSSTNTEKRPPSPISPVLTRMNTRRDFDPKPNKDEDAYAQDDDDYDDDGDDDNDFNDFDEKISILMML